MTIQSFAFEDRDSGWRLEETSFSQLNLLVGVSGAGKTRILEAFHDVRRAALSGARGIPSSSWTLTVEAEGACYTWEAETKVTRAVLLTGARDLPSSDMESDARFVRETVYRDGEQLLDRSSEFLFQNQRLPRLPDWQGAIHLLQSEDAIGPLHSALRRWQFADLPFPLAGTAIIDLSGAGKTLERYSTVEELRNANGLGTLVKLYVLQENFRELFESVCERYREIFPTVSDLEIASYRKLGWKPEMDAVSMDQRLTVGLDEQGIDGRVVQDLSAGMMKVLVYLTELALAPPGSVFLVDELENSLGINCLPEIADYFLEKSRDVQFILTSHHPQVINKIPSDHWKLVTRRGSIVRILDGPSIPELQTASPLRKFTQLINLPQYEEGVT